jgi:hypothetical protein
MDTTTIKSPATETSDDSKAAIDKALGQLYAWADGKSIPRQAILDALRGDEATGDADEHLPPFHTVLFWTDIFTPEGLKLHVTVREGATAATIEKLLAAATDGLEPLLSLGWRSADRPPKTDAEIEATKAAMAKRMSASGEIEAQTTEGKVIKAVAKVARPPGAAQASTGSEEATETKTIKVESIFKGVTEGGNVRYTVKGFPFHKFGVTAWPDSSQITKLAPCVDLETWEIGQAVDFSDTEVHAVVRLKEGGKSDKVVDFIGADVLADAA